MTQHSTESKAAPHADAARHARVLGALRDALGASAVQGPGEFAGRRHADASRMPCADPIALVRPADTQQVALALKICHSLDQPVVTQGGLTGLSGGACLGEGEVALSLERMRGIEHIDTAAATMTVLAGTPLQTVQEAAHAAGLLFALDLGARGSATIGGNLATNAGGNRVIRYGMAREQVLDVEAVLADGQVIGGRHRMIKNNTGYDLRQLLIGSEGTLAVITRAVLRLHPRPAALCTAFCGLADCAAATTLLSRAQAALPAGVSAFEVMWPGYHDFVTTQMHGMRPPLPGSHGFYVLLESSAANAQRQAQDFEDFLGDMLQAGIIEDAAIAASQSDAAAFWAIRDAPGEYERYLPGRVSFDISFAISDISEAARRCQAALRAGWPQASILVYGHLGDGNIHIVVQEPGWSEASRAAVQATVFGITGEMNGSVSAEHGIGLKRKHVLGLTRTPAEIATMRAIKAALDPKGLLNRGKVFDYNAPG